MNERMIYRKEKNNKSKFLWERRTYVRLHASHSGHYTARCCFSFLSNCNYYPIDVPIYLTPTKRRCSQCRDHQFPSNAWCIESPRVGYSMEARVFHSDSNRRDPISMCAHECKCKRTRLIDGFYL